MNAVEILYEEHDHILTMLNILEKIVDQAENTGHLDPSHIGKVVIFLKGYADGCHHGKEEDMLFPALVDAGIPRENGPVEVMLHEHTVGREFIAGMSQSLEGYKAGTPSMLEGIMANARNYIDLLRNHIAKENRILFPMAERVLDGDELGHLTLRFEMFMEQPGVCTSPDYLGILQELQSAYSAV